MKLNLPEIKATVRKSEKIVKGYKCEVLIYYTPTKKFKEQTDEVKADLIAELSKLTYRDFDVNSDTGEISFSVLVDHLDSYFHANVQEGTLGYEYDRREVAVLDVNYQRALSDY